MNELVTSGISGLWVVPALEWAKRSDWPLFKWVNAESARYVSLGVAVAGALGLHFHFDWTTHQFTLDGDLDLILHALSQYTAQHFGYRGYQAVDTLKSIRDLLEKATITKEPQ